MMKVGVVDRLLSTGNSDMVHFGTDLQEKCKGDINHLHIGNCSNVVCITCELLLPY